MIRLETYSFVSNSYSIHDHVITCIRYESYNIISCSKPNDLIAKNVKLFVTF